MPKFIDLFAGIGGIRIPFEELNYECVFSSEWDKFAQQTYQANFGEFPHGDITKIDPADIPKHDLLLAGFPCQPFSNAGLRKGFDDERGELFFTILDIVKYHQPSVLLLENVKGFKNHDKGNTYKVVKKSLEDEGYYFLSDVLNARDFGVPQNRERIYMVAFRDNYKDFVFPVGRNDKAINVGKILQKKVDSKYTISDKLWAGHQRRKEAHRKKGNGFGYSIVNTKSLYTNTLSARYYKDGSEILIKQRGKNPRKLTPREAARLQGFSDKFKIVVSDNQAYKQFGNSVAVPVIRAIALEIDKYFSLEKNN